MAKRPNIRKQITQAKQAIKEIMQEQLAVIAENMITQVIGKAKGLTESQMLNAIKDIEPKGVAAYKDLLTTGLAVIALDAAEQAKREVPKKKAKLTDDADSIQLDDFAKLSPAMQRKVKSRAQLMLDSTVADLEKVVKFQYTSSYASTESLGVIQQDIEEAAEDFITGQAIEAGSGVAAATVINEAREDFFNDPEILNQFEAFQFVNADDDRTTPLCHDLNGTIFAKDDAEAARYKPPLHWNCRSYTIPILDLKGREIEKLKPSKSKFEDDMQFSECKCGCSK